MVLQCINGVSSNPVKGRTKNLTAQKSNSNTVWFNFQMYILYVIQLSDRVYNVTFPAWDLYSLRHSRREYIS
jgi:hypothetical protein